MGVLENFPFKEVAERGSIRESDVAQLRRALYEDGLVSIQDAEQLIALNAACPIQGLAWCEVFQEAITDFIVRQAEPEGYVTLENAQWLIRQLAPHGTLTARKDLDIIVDIIDVARWSPELLIDFALHQVKHAITKGTGALRNGGHSIGVIDDDEVELVRRMIYAFGGDGNIAVTRAEAALLCDINDNLDTERMSEAWTELFVKAMANFLLGNSGYKAPTREEALRSQIWLETRGDLMPVELIKSIANVSLDDIIGVYSQQSQAERTLARLEQQRRHIITGEAVTRDEAEWLIERLARDGRLTPAETALIAYIRENALDIDPRFDELLDRHLTAA